MALKWMARMARSAQLARLARLTWALLQLGLQT